jgi:hypothetical protein
MSQKRKRLEKKKQLVSEICGLLILAREKNLDEYFKLNIQPDLMELQAKRKRMEEFKFTIEARLHTPK